MDDTNTAPEVLSAGDVGRLLGVTRDHVTLLVRQKRLKGRMLGLGLVITREDFEEYVANYRGRNKKKTGAGRQSAPVN